MDLDTLTLKDSEQDDELNKDASDEGTVDEQDDERVEERSNEEGENNLEENHSARGGQVNTKFSMTYRDVQDSIKTFTGKDTYPVERWIAEFEDAANLFEWSELQKLVFAKKSLAGSVKMLIDSEGVIVKEIKRNSMRRIYRQNKQRSNTRNAGQKKIEER